MGRLLRGRREWRWGRVESGWWMVGWVMRVIMQLFWIDLESLNRYVTIDE